MLTLARQATLACTKAMAFAAMMAIALMALTICYDVLARFAFAAPTDWAYPLNAAGVLVVTSLAIPYLYATRRHISMDLLYRSMPPRMRRFCDIITMVATALLGLTFAMTAYRSMVVAFSRTLVGSGTFTIPLWIPDAVLLATGGMLTLVALLFPPATQEDDTAPGEEALTTAGIQEGAAK